MANQPARRRWLTRQTRRRLRNGLLFASPWLIGFVLFMLYPMVASLIYGATNYTLGPKPTRFVGLQNYTAMLTDRQFVQALNNTLYLTLVGNPIWLLFGFVTALLLNLKVRGQTVYRTVYFLPMAVPLVPMTLAWLWILNPQYGLANHVLGWFGLQGPNWFADPAWSKPALILMQAWPIALVTIVYLAALQAIPQELYESAQLDGANGWRQLWHITVPLVSPATLFNLITGIIWSLQVFTPVFVIGTAAGGVNAAALGAPQGSLLVYGLYVYTNAFKYLKMGYASALAWVLFLIILAITLFTFWISRRWTYYEATEMH